MRGTLAYLAILLLVIPGLRAQDSTHIYEVKAIPRIELDKESTGLRSGICGTTLRTPVAVRVSDSNGSPLEGCQVAFSIMAWPEGSEGAGLTESMVLTDSTGQASTGLTLGSRPGLYRISCRTEEGFPDNEVFFIAKASKRNWVWMLIIGLFGGLGLFLFGMNTMSEGLQQSAGQRMRSILELVTRNRLVGVGVGAVVTGIIQSSSATSVMLVSFVNAGLIRFRQTIPVLLGSGHWNHHHRTDYCL